MITEILNKYHLSDGTYHDLLVNAPSFNDITDENLQLKIAKIKFSAVHYNSANISKSQLLLLWKHRQTLSYDLIVQLFGMLCKQNCLTSEILNQADTDYGFFFIANVIDNIPTLPEYKFIFIKYCEGLIEADIIEPFLSFKSTIAKIPPATLININKVSSTCLYTYEQLIQNFNVTGYIYSSGVRFENIMNIYNSATSICNREALLSNNSSFTANELINIYKTTKSVRIKQAVLNNPNCPDSLKLRVLQ